MFASQGLLDDIEAQLDRVLARDVSSSTPIETEEAVLALDRLKAKLAAVESKLCRKYRSEGEWALKGAQHPAAVVATIRRVPSRSCRRPFTLAEELGRTPRQRRLDALVRMAVRSATGPETGRRGAILASILLGPDAARWLCEFTTGVRIRPGQLGPHLDDLRFETFLFGEGMRDVSVSPLRFFVDALRRAAQGKGRQCFHPFCDRPVAECQIDHRVPHSRGGATSIANSQPGCPFHNGAKGDRLPDGGPAP